jgi:hypothetical protein
MLQPATVIVPTPSIPLGPREHGKQIDKNNRECDRAKEKVEGHGIAFYGSTSAMPSSGIKLRGELSVAGIKPA